MTAVRWRGLILAAPLVAASACGARTQIRGGALADASPSIDVDGVVMRSCSPTDGPALLFTLGAPAPSCQAPVIGTGALIMLWSPLPAGAGTFVIGDGSPNAGSGAYVCAAANDCKPATGGTLVLTELSSVASGSYTLSASDGTTVSASFSNIVVCDNPLTCG